jgi:hypothetical protein
MTYDLNLAVHASKGLLPESGGILDQDAKFIHTWQSFQADKDLILEERRQRNGK